MVGIDEKVIIRLPKKNLTVVLQNCEKSAVKHSTDSLTTFCSRLSEETYFDF